MSEHHDHRPEEVLEPPRLRRTLRLLGVAAVAVAIAVAAGGILSRNVHATAVAEWTETAAVPTVSLADPKQGTAGQELVLPGDIEAWYSAPVYAQVNGYLKAWYFDYGARVMKGQVLADIETPEIDAEFSAAKAKFNAADAAVKVRVAEAHFAETTFARWRDAPKGVVSVQEQQDKQADYESAVARLNAARADVAVAQAEVDRLQALENFKRVTAPFDGVVTARETDIGALINAGSGSGGGSAPELFRVADIHEMRVYAKVPQRMASPIHVGMKARAVPAAVPRQSLHGACGDHLGRHRSELANPAGGNERRKSGRGAAAGHLRRGSLHAPERTQCFADSGERIAVPETRTGGRRGRARGQDRFEACHPRTKSGCRG